MLETIKTCSTPSTSCSSEVTSFVEPKLHDIITKADGMLLDISNSGSSILRNIPELVKVPDIEGFQL